jgi:hypothetical protein
MAGFKRSSVWILGSGGLIGTSFSTRIANWSVEQVRLHHRVVSSPSIDETAVGFDVYLNVHSSSHLDWVSRDKRLPDPSEIVLLGWGNVRNPHHTTHASISPFSVEKMAVVSIMRGARRVVFAGSIDEYGGANGRRHEKCKLPNPMNSYVDGKIRARVALEDLCRAHGVKYVHCRISNVYGPTRVSDSLVQTLWEAHVQGAPVDLGPCDVWRDHVYVEDVSEAIRLLLHSELVGTFNVGFGKPTQVKQLAESLWVAFGENRETLRFTGDSDVAVVGASPDWYLDLGRMKGVDGWRPQYDLNAGARDTHRVLTHIRT